MAITSLTHMHLHSSPVPQEIIMWQGNRLNVILAWAVSRTSGERERARAVHLVLWFATWCQAKEPV